MLAEKRKEVVPLSKDNDRRPKTTCIGPGRKRDDEQGIAADLLPSDPIDDRQFKDMVEDITELLAKKEAKEDLPLVDFFRDMMAGSRGPEQRQLYGDKTARETRRIIIQTIQEYASSTGNEHLRNLLARLLGEEPDREVTLKKAVPAPKLTDQEWDYASILAVVDRFERPIGSSDLGKYRRKWLDYPPRNPLSGYKNRLEEVLAKMVQEKVITGRQTRSGAMQYLPGPEADKYRRGAPVE